MSDYQAKWNLANAVEESDWTIGQILKSAREHQDLTIEQIGEQLHLRASLISALEIDDYADIPSAYVRGYIRSYAKLLGLDQSVIQEKLSSHTEDECPSVRQPVRKSAPSKNDAFLRFGAGSVLLLVIGILVIWWFYPQSDRATNFTDISVEDSLFSTDSSELAESVASTELVAKNKYKPVVDELELNNPSTEANPKIESTTTAIEVDSVPLSQVRSGNNKIVADETPVEQDLTETVSSVSLPAETTVVGRAQMPLQEYSDQLIIRYVEESWTVITDAHDRELLRGLYKPGAIRMLSGDAPFHVFLGNSPGVVISINGKEFDQSRFTRSNNTARFELTDSST